MEAGQRNRELGEEKEQDSHAMGAVWPSQLPSPEESLQLMWLSL